MKIDYNRDPFFQVPITSTKTQQGDVQLPMFFTDTSNLIAAFRTDAEGVAKLLEGKPFGSALSLGGKPLVFISFYKYRESSVGAYNEVGLAIPVVPDYSQRKKIGLREMLRSPDQSSMGMYIANLPVTTEAADAAGREIWGYPKFVADIDFKLNKNVFFSEVKDPQSTNILRLEGGLNLGIKAPSLSGATYSMLGEKILRATVNVRGDYKLHPAHRLKLRIGESNHDMAENLRLLGLNHRRPITVLSCQNFQSRLSDGAEID